MTEEEGSRDRAGIVRARHANRGPAPMLTDIPCLLMRGGTSKGPYFLAEDLPADPAVRDRVLLAVMGSPHVRQIDGIGGGDSLTSKAVIVYRSVRPGIDIEYLVAP